MNVQRITITAVCIALVFIPIRLIQIPIPATGGFTHPGAIIEIFVAVAFGPIVGAIAAGVGAALADLTSGYASFAPLTLVAHGLLGYLAGYLGWKKSMNGMVTGWLAGGLALVAVYFLGGATIYGFGFAGAGTEVPINLFQVTLGVVGLLLYELVKRAYPQIDTLAGKPGFVER